MPTDIKPRLLSTSIAEDPDLSASLELALEVAGHFGLQPKRARQGIKEVYEAVGDWRRVARSFGLKVKEIERMSTAFEHEDAAAAAAMAS